MAQKSLKTLAAKNAATLNRTHLITLTLHSFFLLLRFTLLSRKFTPYILCTAPALAIEIWFERISRPTHNDSGELRKAGEDLEAKGLTEWMWDVVYWTWGCIGVVILFGDRAWWLYAVVPAYSVYLVVTTALGMKQGLGGLMGQGAEGGGSDSGGSGQSKRQAKMEKRGGQKMVYR